MPSTDRFGPEIPRRRGSPMPAAIDRNEMPENRSRVANAAMARYAAGDNSAFSDVYDAVRRWSSIKC